MIATWLMLLSFLLRGWPGMERFVLCIGEDGHVAIEEAHNGLCGGKGEGRCDGAHHPNDQDHGFSRSSCGDCLDIPIMDAGSMPLPSSTKILFNKILDPVSGDRFFVCYREARSYPCRFGSLAFPVADPFLESLRTIVLLI